MNKKDVFNKSLQASRKLIDSLTKEQLEEIMNVFDNYEVEQLNLPVVVRQSEQLFCECDMPELDKWLSASVDIKECIKCDREIAK